MASGLQTHKRREKSRKSASEASGAVRTAVRTRRAGRRRTFALCARRAGVLEAVAGLFAALFDVGHVCVHGEGVLRGRGIFGKAQSNRGLYGDNSQSDCIRAAYAMATLPRSHGPSLGTFGQRRDIRCTGSSILRGAYNDERG